MEKSIETIWKEGFLKSDALIAPKINNLYNKKSIDIVEKFKKMYRINRIAIAVFALIILIVSFIAHIPYLGILMFILFTVILFVSGKFKKKLDNINKSDSSYVYLNSFNNIIKELVSTNTKLSRYLYPYVFIVMIIGFWFQEVEGDLLGNNIVNKLVLNYPDMYMLFGLPVFGILGTFLIIFLLAFFGGKIGQKIEGLQSHLHHFH